jgi:hypothetical protein
MMRSFFLFAPARVRQLRARKAIKNPDKHSIGGEDGWDYLSIDAAETGFVFEMT